MRLIANENIPRAVVDVLKKEGHEVVWIRTEQPGSSDRAVLQLAQAEGRILLTFDKDFGELAFRFGLPANCGIILLLTASASPELAAAKVLAALNSVEDFRGHFAVIEEDRIRLTPLPKP